MRDPLLESSPNAEIPIAGDESLSASARNVLEQEIARLQSAGMSWLRHPPPLEGYFEAATSATRSRRIWIEGIFCVALFDAFLIPDYLFSPRTFVLALVLRLGLATPACVVVLILLRRGVSKAVREGMVVFICALFAASQYLYLDINAVVSSYAVTNLAILVLFTNVGMRIRLPYAIFASALCLVFGSIFLHADSMLTTPQKFQSLAVLLSAIFLSLVGNYSIERAERLNFLLRLRSEAESGALANANDRLSAYAREDRLTRIPNRGHFDEVYKKIWKESVTTASTLSMIMVDVDNFKILNDTYGHPYGDSVLRRVATLLKQCMRREGTSWRATEGKSSSSCCPILRRRQACAWQNARLLIEVAGSPAIGHKVSDEHGWATVSCGVATVLPRAGINRSRLISSADEALYQAKSEGRNRVCVAPDVSLGQGNAEPTSA